MIKSNLFSKNNKNNKPFQWKNINFWNIFLKPHLNIYTCLGYFIHTTYQFDSQIVDRPSRFFWVKKQIPWNKEFTYARVSI